MRKTIATDWRSLGTALLALVPALGGCAGDFGAGGDTAGAGADDQQVLASGFYIDPNSSVLVRAPRVVDDPTRTIDPCLNTDPNDALDAGARARLANRKWTFGYLMSQMANGITPDAFARSWLSAWETSTVLNNSGPPDGDPLVEVRPDAKRDGSITNTKPLATLVREAWQQASGGAGKPLAMNKAPFRLLAIVNRFDLRKAPRRFGEGTGGELRFVFSVLALNGPGAFSPGQACAQYTGIANPDFGERGEQMVILEYAVNLPTDAAKRDWVMRWADLTNYERGSEDFASRLQSLTEQVVVRGAGGSTRPNGSALIRIRTNETPNEVQWDLREFKIASTHGVVPDMVKQTPRGNDNGSADLGLWMQRNGSAILADTYVVPNQLPRNQGYSSVSFLGAHALNQVGNTVWAGSSRYPVSADVRHEFSKNTCSGCHSRETGSLFFHVHGREVGQESAVSGFLGGADGYGNDDFCTSDPVTGQQRCFNELRRRTDDLLSFLNTGV